MIQAPISYVCVLICLAALSLPRGWESQASTPPVEIGRWPDYRRGWYESVAVSGNHVYAGTQAGLQALDFTDPANPRLVWTQSPAEVLPQIRSLIVSSNRLYAQNPGLGLLAFDLGDPAKPATVGGISIPFTDTRVAFAGNRLLLADRGTTWEFGRFLSVLRVVDPARSMVEATLVLTNFQGAVALAVSDGLAFLAPSMGELQIVDIRDPSRPRSVGRFASTTDFQLTAVAARGPFAYLATARNGIIVLDANNPAAPVERNRILSSVAITGLTASGDNLFAGAVKDQAGSLRVLSVTNRTEPVEIGRLEVNAPRELAITGTRLAGITGEGLVSIDIADPHNPVRRGQYQEGSGQGVALAGNIAYLADGAAGLQVLDVSEPRHPRSLLRLAETAPATDIALLTNRAVVAMGWVVRVLDISTPTQPIKVLDLPARSANSVAVSGPYAFVTDYFDGLIVLDLSDPKQPRRVAGLELAEGAHRVAVADGLAAVAAGVNGWFLIDVSDPARPRILARHPGQVDGIALRGRNVLVTDHTTGLHVFDTTFPSAPQRIGRVAMNNSRYPTAIDVVGNRAYLGLMNHGIDVYDLTDLTQLKLVATLPKTPPLYGGPVVMREVAVAGTRIFVADPTQGLVIFDEPPAPVIRTPLTAQRVRAGEAASWTVDAIGTAPLAFQWFKDGKPVLGATKAELIIPIATSQDAGAYAVEVRDANGTVTSNPALLTVDPRHYTIQSLSAAIAEGGTWRIDLAIAPAVIEAFTVGLAPGDGTAQSGDDYRLGTESILLVPGATQTHFFIETIKDEQPEVTETLVLTLQSADPNKASLDENARLTLTLRDSAGRIEFGVIPVLHEGAGTVDIPVRREPPATGPATVQFSVEPGSSAALPAATAGKDFTRVAGTLSFQAGETLRHFRLPILDDTEREVTESLVLKLENAQGGELPGASSLTALVELLDDDGVFEFVTGTNNVAEGVGWARLAVRRVGPTHTTQRLDYQTAEFSAREGTDYTGRAETLTFAPGETVKEIQIPILDDSIDEVTEGFTIQLRARPGDWAVAGSGFGFVFIFDDDKVQAAPPLVFQPRPIGRWPGYERGPAATVAVQGRYAYVGGQGVQILDISDGAQPRRVGEFSTPNQVTAITVSGPYAYLGDYRTGLHILDITDPQKPRSVGKLAAVGAGQGYAINGDIVVAEGRAYVPGQIEGGIGARLWIFDVAQPTAPRLLGAFSLSTGAFGSVAVSGNYAYVENLSNGQPAAAEAILVIDVSDPANPRRAGGYGQRGARCHLVLAGNYLFATGLGETMTVLDISAPSSPRRVAGYQSSHPSNPGPIAIAGHRAYLSSFRAGFPNPPYSAIEAIDISDPLQPWLVSTSAQPNLGHPFEIIRLVAADQRVYGAAEDEGLFVFDFGQAQSPVLASRIDTSGSTTSVALDGNIAVVADTTAGVRVLDVADPANPAEIGRYDPATPTESVLFNPPYVYAANRANRWMTSSLQVLDLTNPRQPRARGEVSLDPISWRLRLAQLDPQHVLAATTGFFDPALNRWRGKLQVFQVADPDRPALIATLEFNDEVRNVVVSGRHAYVLETVTQVNRGVVGARVNIVDLTDPRLPRKAGEYFTSNSNYAGDIAVAGDFAYLSIFLPAPRLEVLDVRDPANPTRIRTLNINHYHSLAVHGLALYAYGSFDGIQSFDLSKPTEPRAIGAISFPPKRFPVFQQSYGGLAIAGGLLFVPNTTAGVIILDTQSRIEIAAPQFSAIEEDGHVRIRVRRSGNPLIPVQVGWTLEQGTATAGVDFATGTNGLIYFPAGAEEQSFLIPLLDDTLDEGSETFRVRLVNPSAGASLGASGTADVIVEDGSALFEFAAANVSADEAAGQAEVTVRHRPADRPGPATIHLATAPGSALADQDFTPVSITLSFAPGETAQSVSIPIRDDAVFHGDRSFEVRLSDASSGAQIGRSVTRVNIADDDARVLWAYPIVYVKEGAGTARLDVQRIGSTARSARVDFATAGGTATAGVDFAAVLGTLVFEPGETTRTITVPLLNDTLLERSETFLISLSSSDRQTTVIAPATAEIVIVDDDVSEQLAGALNPVHVASWPGYERGPANNVAVRGQHAYIGGQGIQIFDISNPANPKRVGDFSTPTYIESITIAGTYAYMSDFNNGLQVFDLADPLRPQRIGAGPAANNGQSYWVRGNITLANSRAFVPGADGGNKGARLWIYDVVNPAAPRRLGEFALPEGAFRSVAVKGNYAYLTFEWFGATVRSALLVLDVSDPANPRQVSSYPSAPAAGEAVLAGDYLLATCLGDALTVLDISEPINPRRVAAYKSPRDGWFHQVAVEDNRAYLVSFNDGPVESNRQSLIEVIDLTDPLRPQLAGSSPVVEIGHPSQITRFAVAGQRVYGAASAEGLLIYDFADPTRPSLASHIDIDGMTSGVALDGNLACLADGTGGVRILDVSQPGQPTEIGRYRSRNSVQSLVLAPPYAYLAAAETRWQIASFTVLDLSNPRIPARRGELRLDPGIFNLEAHRLDTNLVLVTSTSWDPDQQKQRSRIRVVDVENPDHPATIASIVLEDQVNYVAVAGRFAYLLSPLTQTNGIATGVRVRVWDFTNPSQPHEAGSYSRPNDNYAGSKDLVVAGSHLYMATHSPDPRIVVLDIRDPSRPVFVHSQPFVWHAALAVNDNVLYAFSPFNGVDLFDISNPTSHYRLGQYRSPPQRHPIGTPNYGVMAVADGRLFLPNVTAGLTILDSSARIEFAAPTFSAIEEDGAATLQVRRSGVTSIPVQLDWTATPLQTALPGAPATAPLKGIVTIPAGSSVQSFRIPIPDDAIAEEPEQFQIELSNPSLFGAIGMQRTALLTVTDRPTTEVQFADTDAIVTEDQATAQITVTRTGDQPRAFTVEILTAPGTALSNEDFAPIATTLNFAAHETTKRIDLPILNNGTSEADEEFHLTLRNPSTDVTLGARSNATVHILDNDQGFEFVTTDLIVEESQLTVTLTVRRGSDLDRVISVDYSTGNITAMAGADYPPRSGTLTFAPGQRELSISIPILDDSFGEGEESFQITLNNPSTGTSLGPRFIATVTILDDDPIVHFSAAAWSVRENAGSVALTVVRERALDRPARVEYLTRNGDARSGTDFTLASGTLVFEHGEASKDIPISILNDSQGEAFESFSVVLSATGDGTGLSHPSEAVVQIQDDDGPVSVFNFEIASVEVDELAGQVIITVTRAEPAAGNASVTVSTRTGTATSGMDFHPAEGTLRFSDRQTQSTIGVAIVEDQLPENDESFTLALSNPVGEPGATARLGDRPTTTITIKDARNAVAFSQMHYDGFETNGGAVITLRRRGGIDRPFTVSYATRDGSAVAGQDYLAQSGSLSFVPGQITNAFAVPILDDFAAEGPEQFTVLLSDPTDGALVHPPGATATVGIYDNERRIPIDPQFNARLTPDSSVNALVRLPDGKILIAGWFRFATTEPLIGIARLLPDGARDPDFQTDLGALTALGAVTAMTLQPDGSIVLGAHFTSGSQPAVLRIDGTGKLDPTFSMARIDGQSPTTLELQPDGKILVAGYFTSIAGAHYRTLARLHPNGSVDLSFNPGSGATYRSQNQADTTDYLATIYGVRVTAEGKIYVAGTFLNFNGLTRPGIVRLHPNGAVDSSFDPGAGAVIPPQQWQPMPYPAVRTLLLQDDSKVLIGGWFTTVGGQPSQGLARLNPDGTRDPSVVFGRGQISWLSVTALALQPDGSLVVGGEFQSLDGVYRPSIVRLNPDGTLDPRVGLPSSINAPAALALEPTGNILVAGYFDNVDGAVRSKLIRVLGDDIPRRTLDLEAPSWTVTENATNLVVGLRRGGDSGDSIAVNLATVDGSAKAGQQYEARNLTITFAPGEIAKQAVIPILDNGRLNEPTVFDVRLHNPSAGTLIGLIDQARVDILDNEIPATFDPGFTPDLNGTVGRAFPLPDGEYLISGADTWTAFSRVDGVDTGSAARLLPNGALDRSFDPRSIFTLEDGNCCYAIFAVLPQADGKVYYGGHFQFVHGVRRPGLVRLNADDSLDTTFSPAEEIGSGARALALQPDGKLVVAMDSGLWRLLPDGSVDRSFNTGETCCITTITLLANGQIVVGGHFGDFNGRPRHRLARLLPDGTLDDTFVPIEADPVTGYSFDRLLAIQSDGSPLLTGYSDDGEGNRRDSFIRLGRDGSIDASFQAASVVKQYHVEQITSAITQPDGGLVVAAYANPLPTGGYGGLLLELDPNGAILPTKQPVPLPGLYQGKGDSGLRILPSQTPAVPNHLVVSANFPALTGRPGSNLIRIDLGAAPDDSKFAFERGEGLVMEGSTAAVSVIRFGDVTRPESVRYDIRAAVGLTGFNPLEGTLNFDPLAHRRTVLVPIPDNAVPDTDRQLEVMLSNPVGGASIAGGTAVITVLDDETLGAIDLGFDAGLETPPGWDMPSVAAVRVLPDGRLRVDGNFVTVHGSYSESTALLNPDGSLAPESSAPETPPLLRFPQPDGSSLGFHLDRFVRWTANGSPDPSFTVTIEPLHSVSSATLQPDASVVIAGAFERVAGIPRTGLARLLPNGTLDTSFDPAPRFTHQPLTNRYFTGVLAQPDGKLFVAGNIVSYDGVPRNGLLRLNADTSLDTSFDPRPRLPTSGMNAIRSMLLQPDGKLLVLGRLTLAEPSGRPDLVRLNPDGTLDPSFAPLGRPYDEFNFRGFDVMTFGPGSTLYVGGSFRGRGPARRDGLMRLLLRFTATLEIDRAGFDTDGNFTLTVKVETGKRYELHASDDLRTWTLLTTAIATRNTLEFSDPTLARLNVRFYRVLQVPAP